jgi:hypothetical protein
VSEQANEAIEHLQNAAVEVIKATRSFLDLAEELVAEPGHLLGLAGLIGDLAARGRAAASPSHDPDNAADGDGEGDGQGAEGGESRVPGQPTGVQHIRVS